ncbi:MAG: hypothetical protein KKG60_03075 [Nanoarchaeota archaeon]|nr:hypothetical protein [Nanoarchaeota archaeon]
MNPINFVPLMIVTFALIFSSFTKKKNTTYFAFIIWLVIFFLTFFVGQ